MRNGGLIIFLSFVAALLLTVFPLPESLRLLRPQWYTLVLIYWVLALPHRIGVGIAWSLGILVDVLTGTLLGQHALTLSIIAFITLKQHQTIRLSTMWQQSLTILGLLLLEKLLHLWVIGAFSRITSDWRFWISLLIGALFWPWIYLILRDLRRKFQVR